MKTISLAIFYEHLFEKVYIGLGFRMMLSNDIRVNDNYGSPGFSNVLVC